MNPATLFERRMENALKANTDAMFKVAIGDSHRHALIVGERRGLESAMDHFKAEYSDKDEF